MKPLLSLWLLAAFAAVAPAMAEDAVYTIPHFSFEAGGVLENMKVGYATYGKREAGNVIVLVPPTSGLKSWAAAHVGPGKTFDSDKHFIVAIDAIGGGTSSQPRDGLGTRFPAYSIRDMVRAQHELLVRGLKVDHVLAIAGASSGAYQALEWGIQHPDFARGLVLYVPAARADRHVKAIADAIISTLELDPAFTSAAPPSVGSEAVRHAAVVYYPWLIAAPSLEAFSSDEELTKAQKGFADSWARNWDAVGLAWRYKSSKSHDVSAPFGGDMKKALERVTAAVLILPSTTDRTHPIEMSETMRRGMTNARVVYAPLESTRGHAAVFRAPGTAEYDFVSSQTREFLNTLR